MTQPTRRQIYTFQAAVLDYFAAHGRDLPWRHPDTDGTFDPYKIMVSEAMLQQTQVNRVIPKYHAFLESFPDIQSLAAAELQTVLLAWSGLGYNRRARFLWQAARMVQAEHSGQLPMGTKELERLPGIGPNTAAAIAAYAYNQPVVFIETNIRTVFIHHFFQDQSNITDKDILTLVEITLPNQNVFGRAAGESGSAGSPRDEKPDRRAPASVGPRLVSHRIWYWALMDYGTHLKATVGNLNARSKHYVRQVHFHGSRRQLRGQVLRLLAAGPLNSDELAKRINDDRLAAICADLTREGLIHEEQSCYFLG